MAKHDNRTGYYLANTPAKQEVPPEPAGRKTKYLDLAGNVIRVEGPKENKNVKPNKTTKR